MNQSLTVLALASICTTFAGCSKPSTTTTTVQAQTAAAPARAASIPAADRPPSALTQIGDSATMLYDAAYADDWSATGEWMQSISAASSALPPVLPQADLVGQLQSRVRAEAQHVRAHDRIRAMDDANALTRLAAELSADFQPQVPYEVLMLGYYGRQLELGIVAARPATLTQANADLRAAWNRIEPSVERRGIPDEARRFTDIVAQLEQARRPADFVAPTRAELAQADRIVKAFKSPS
jgi:hypothetical protein